MNRIHTILIVLFSLLPLHSSGQGVEEHIVFNKLTISGQIWPIHIIFQDHKGMMWFSGKNYLLSYDGNRMDTISISNVKGEVFITGILESINADLAVSTTKGLYIIGPGSDGTVSYESVLDGCINIMIAQDKDHLWLGTNQGLLYYSGLSLLFRYWCFSSGTTRAKSPLFMGCSSPFSFTNAPVPSIM